MIRLQSILWKDLFISREDGAEGLGLDVGILFGRLDDLVQNGDICEALSVATIVNLFTKTYFGQ